MSRGRSTRGRGALWFGDDGFLPDESLDIRTEFVGRLAESEFEVIGRESDKVFRHFDMNSTFHTFHLGFVYLSHNTILEI
jgi:hypothetical protein